MFGRLYHGTLVQNPFTRKLLASGVKATIAAYRLYLERTKRALISK
jgi:hypothetical protein